MAFSLVAHTLYTGAGPSSAINTTGANLIFRHWDNNSTGFAAVTDSKGNTWTDFGLNSTGSNSLADVMGYCAGAGLVVGTGHTFSNNGSVVPSESVAAFSGAATSPFDQYVNAQNTSPANSIATGSATATVDGSLFITGAGMLSTGTFSPPSGFTLIDSNPSDLSTYYGNALSYAIKNIADGAINPSTSWSGSTSVTNVAVLGVFKPGAGGGGNVVSGGATEGADATSGSIKVAIKASGGPTEGKDATSGSIKVALKVSGGITEGADTAAGAIKVAVKVSGGPTEGADSTSGSLSVGSTHVSGAIMEGADASSGSITVALKVSGAIAEGADSSAGSVKIALKVSGGPTEGPDATSGSITATSRTISGAITEGADAMSGQIISGTVSQGGHFLPLTKKELASARKRAKAAREAEQAGWDQAARDKAEIHKQIMATLHPEKILGPGKPIETVEEDDDEADIEMLLLYG